MYSEVYFFSLLNINYYIFSLSLSLSPTQWFCFDGPAIFSFCLCFFFYISFSLLVSFFFSLSSIIHYLLIFHSNADKKEHHNIAKITSSPLSLSLSTIKRQHDFFRKQEMTHTLACFVSLYFGLNTK